MVEAGIEQLNSAFVDSCCKIPISLINLKKGEQTAHVGTSEVPPFAVPIPM
jgi:hypothetical protein